MVSQGQVVRHRGLALPFAPKYHPSMRLAHRANRCFVAAATVLVLLGGSRIEADEPVAAAHVSALGGMVKREGVIGGDAFFDLAHRGFRMTLGVPLRFQPGDGVRREDWDERSDYGRVVREVSYSSPDQGIVLRAAPLTGYSLGVGNLVSGFYSTLDSDHWRTGFEGAYHGATGGMDVFVDSVPDPEILGARLHVKPFHVLHPDGLFGRLEVGGSLVGDLAAPGEFVVVAGSRVLDAAGLPRARRRTVSASGVDARWPVLKSREVEVVPYFALAHAKDGSGWHVGLALDLHPKRSVRFGLQGELRRLGNGYVAPYFDSLYMVDRWDIGGLSKASLLGTDAPGRRWGFGTGLTLRLEQAFSAFLLFDFDGDGRFTTMRAGAQAVIARRLSLNLTLLSRGIPRFARLFDPERVVFGFSCEVALSRFFTAFASYAHEPHVHRNPPDLGWYGSSDTILSGLRLSFGNR